MIRLVLAHLLLRLARRLYPPTHVVGTYRGVDVVHVVLGDSFNEPRHGAN